MAESNINGEPVFVDVAPDDNYPMLVFSHSHLTNPQDSAEPAPVHMEIESNTTSMPNKEIQAEKLDDEECVVETKIDSIKEESTNPCLMIENRKIKCPECKRFSAETEEKMLRHIRRVHRGENPFQCYMCDYSTYNKAVFEEHVRIHQGIKPFKCSQCDYRSASKKNAKKHEAIHRPDNPLRCNCCDFIARNPQSLQCHKSKEHPVKVEGGDYKCKICQTKFQSSLILRKHSKNSKTCKLCTYKTCNSKQYRSHMNYKHAHVVAEKAQTNLFHCALCKWNSNSKPRILLHLIHHPNQTVDEEVVDVGILKRLGIMT